MKKKLFIITGGSGFGKTKIIEELAARSYLTCPEFAREIIEEQVRNDGDILPWKNIKAFQHEVFSRRASFYESTSSQEIAFADRALPDQLAFARFRGFQEPARFRNVVLNYRYADTVFLTPPWKVIYTIDSIRKESFEEACRLHETIRSVYTELGYSLIDIPLGSVDERADFIINYLEKNNLVSEIPNQLNK